MAARALALRAGDVATGLRRHRGPAILLVVIGLQGLLWSVPQLQEGIVEVPMHWWSSLAASPLVAGLAMLVLSFAPWGWRGSRSG